MVFIIILMRRLMANPENQFEKLKIKGRKDPRSLATSDIELGPVQVHCIFHYQSLMLNPRIVS